MNNVEKIRQEIERRRDICEGIFERDSDTYYQGKSVAYDEALTFIDSLPEDDHFREPTKMVEERLADSDKTLEKAAEEYADEEMMSGLAERAFIAGAKWMESQMPMPEDTVIFMKGVAEGRRLEREEMEENKRKEDELPRFYGD